MVKGVINAERMSHEMEAVVDMYEEMGLSSTMAAAAKEKLEWCSKMNLREHFVGDSPDSLEEILDILEEKTLTA
jgi:hypothetical protein